MDDEEVVDLLDWVSLEDSLYRELPPALQIVG